MVKLFFVILFLRWLCELKSEFDCLLTAIGLCNWFCSLNCVELKLNVIDCNNCDFGIEKRNAVWIRVLSFFLTLSFFFFWVWFVLVQISFSPWELMHTLLSPCVFATHGPAVLPPLVSELLRSSLVPHCPYHVPSYSGANAAPETHHKIHSRLFFSFCLFRLQYSMNSPLAITEEETSRE